MDVTLDERASRQTMALRNHLNMLEIEVINLAIQRLHNEVFVNQEPDSGPLSEEYIRFMQAKAQAQINNPSEFDQTLLK